MGATARDDAASRCPASTRLSAELREMGSQAIANLMGVASVATPLAVIALTSFPAQSITSMESFPLSISASNPAHWVALLAASAVIFGAKAALGKFISSSIFAFAGYINPAFPPLERFVSVDWLYLSCNSLITACFLYHFLTFLWTSSISWKNEEISFYNTIASSVAQFAFYDLLYQAFHRFLHLGTIYPWIHKHHHRQKSPFRGVFDGINVHPFEMVVGIYLHLLAVWVVPCHIVGAQIWFSFCSLMAAFNHTRWAIRDPLGVFYDVRDHDMHHVYPNCNYAQYVMWWDRLWGTYKEPPTSRPPLKTKA